MFRELAVSAAALAFALSAAAPADAADMKMVGKDLVFQAQAGERNAVEIYTENDEITWPDGRERNGTYLFVSDSFADLTFGDGCLPVNDTLGGANKIACIITEQVGRNTVATANRIVFNLADGDDSLNHKMNVRFGYLADGGSGNDTIHGGSEFSNTLVGGAGNDKLVGGDNNDKISGGAGSDVIEAEGSNDVISGGAGNDEMYGGAGADLIQGGAGHDMMRGDDGSGGAGSTSGFFDDVFEGGDGSDTVIYDDHGTEQPVRADADGSANDGTSKEHDNIGPDVENLTGGNGDDTLIGDDERNVLLGGNGNDSISGLGAKDRIDGQFGDDQLSAGAGDDDVKGSGGDDQLSGGAGKDTLQGGDGDDRINAQDVKPTRDRVSCSNGNDTVTRDRQDRINKSHACEKVRKP